MTRRLILVALAAGLAVAACGGSKSSAPPATTTVVSTVTASTTTTAPTTTAPAEASCEPAAFLPVLKEAMDDPASKLKVVEAKVQRCRNDYAQVFAVPDPSVCKPGVEYCYETEQVFLHWDGAWRIATSGTGIACGSETDPAIVKICRALGYPDLTTTAFKMPSNNVGCAFYGGTLRCDILSGLVPEPTEGCPYDWVGLVITTGGPAESQCAGDTVYDDSAPTLGYGATWKLGGITCESRKNGLRCRERRRPFVQTRPRGMERRLAPGQLAELRHRVPVAGRGPDAQRPLEVVDRELGTADPVRRVQVDLASGQLELARRRAVRI